MAKEVITLPNASADPLLPLTPLDDIGMRLTALEDRFNAPAPYIELPAEAHSPLVVEMLKRFGDQAQTAELPIAGDLTVTIGIRNVYLNHGNGNLSLIPCHHIAAE